MREQSSNPIRCILDKVVKDIAALPVAAVPLAGAMIAMQTGIPTAFTAFVMSELGKRADLGLVSPAAKAVMWLSQLADDKDEQFAQNEIDKQYALIKALRLEDALVKAIVFTSQLAEHIASIDLCEAEVIKAGSVC